MRSTFDDVATNSQTTREEHCKHQQRIKQHVSISGSMTRICATCQRESGATSRARRRAQAWRRRDLRFELDSPLHRREPPRLTPLSHAALASDHDASLLLYSLRLLHAAALTRACALTIARPLVLHSLFTAAPPPLQRDTSCGYSASRHCRDTHR